MRRALPVSLLLHGLVLGAFALWFSTRVEMADGPQPLLNVRLAPLETSGPKPVEQPEQDSRAPRQPRAAATPDPASSPTAVEPAEQEPPDPHIRAQPPARPARAAAPSPAAPTKSAAASAAARPATPAPAPAAKPTPALVTVPMPVAPEPSVATRRETPAQAPPPARPLAAGQKRMLDRKLKGWAAQLPSVANTGSPLSWTDRGQRYTAHFQTLEPAGETGVEKVLVEISTEQDGAQLSTQVHMRRLAFSNFAQFVDRWDPNVQIHDDELDGRFHANSEITVLYDRKVRPTFHGKVTTTSRRINTTNSKGRSRRKDIFRGGLETGVRRIRLPRRFVPFPEEAAADAARTHYFAADTRITFHGDGSYSWRPLNAARSERRPPGNGPLYLLGGKKVKLYVKGTVAGQVLVHTPERIIIEGDLIYPDYPQVAADSTHFLGLVADKSVEIAAPNVTGPGDLTVNAAIYAKWRFAVRRYRNRENATLTIFGSVTAGSVSATEPRYGTRIRFDPRLKDMRPPRFPLSDRYELDAWDGRWTAAAP
jgi:hypothetical protein